MKTKERVKEQLGERKTSWESSRKLQERKELRDTSRQERDHSMVLGAVLESPLLYSCL